MLDERVPSFGSKIILYSFYLLFFLTPLFWTSINFELFEYNKMMLVYGLTVIITTAWILKMLNQKSLVIKRTPLDIPILLFLASQILSTIFSIDTHTSIWGYYSRSNGGLLSIISYTLLYFALVSNLDKTQALKLLKVGLISGFIVSLWAIPEHFGISPSCVILRGELSADCWVQDVTARVFATLGQPNWLAAYLLMLIFPAIYFLLTAKTRPQTIIYYLLTITYYLAFTFTYSRGATLGLIAGLFIFLLMYGLPHFQKFPPNKVWQGFVFVNLFNTWYIPWKKKYLTHPLHFIIIFFMLINLLFGSALTRFQLTSLLPKASQPTTQNQATGLTQLENGGTESGQIRLIVWQGALEIFKHYPIFGSGVETFAYSYYQFRPASHNLVSEWDFLYNKAHNEYLNYLANTGLVGFLSYILIIIIFLTWSIRKILNNPKTNPETGLLTLAILASYIGFLIQNVFGFSVVIIALFFFLFPAILFVASESTTELKLSKDFFINPAFKVIATILVVFLGVTSLMTIGKYWRGDIYFAQGERNTENGNVGLALEALTKASIYNPNEPYYLSELGYAAASATLALPDDATLSASLKEQAVIQTEEALQKSPKNVSFWRTAIRTYYLLSSLEPGFTQKTLETLDKTISLAPTDPKLYYNKAIILGQIDENDEAIIELQKAIELKKNYRDAYFALAVFYYDQKKYPEAVANMQKVLTLIPNDPDAISQLIDWGKKGIATESAKE